MELFTNCKNCRKEFTIKSGALARNELEDEIGLKFQKQCPECLSSKEYHVNDIKARVSKKQELLVVVFAIILGLVTALFLLGLGWISSLSLAIPLVIIIGYRRNQQGSASAFNQYLLPR